MTIKEIEDYYWNMADNYAREAQDLRHKGEKFEDNEDFGSAVRCYMLSAEKYEKSRLCTGFVNKLVEMEILESTK